MSAGEFRILIAEPARFSGRALERLQTIGDVELRELPEREFPLAFTGYDVVWIRLAHRITEPAFGTAVRCRILATATTGLDHIDLNACQSRGIQVISLRGEREFLRTVRATAEHTIAILLALIRRIPQATRCVLEGRWDRDAFQGTELFGKTAGVVGYGRIGSIVAGYYRAFGMSVLAYDVGKEGEPGAEVEFVDSLDELVRRSEIVSIHSTYNDSTHHLFDAGRLARCRQGAILVNTARGQIVETGALLDALRSGRLSGAALDVLEGEPGINADHPLVRYAQAHENLLITPHLGGNTTESFEKTEVFIADKIVRCVADR